jgi:hypothetical protein
MKFLPFEKLTYTTALKEDEIMWRLESILEEEKIIRLRIPFVKRKDGQPYEGSTNGNTFEMQRIINYRNSFLPVIEGRVEDNFTQRHVHVKMRLNRVVMIFMMFWCGILLFGIGAMTFVSNADSNPKGEVEPVLKLIPIFMLLFGYGLTTFFFKLESKKSKKFIKDLLDAEEVMG